MIEFTLKDAITLICTNIQAPTLIEHVTAILCSESDDTRVYYKFYTTENFNALAIILKNNNEGFSHLHYFYMDSVDKKFDQYLYFSMPLSNLKVFIEQSKEWLTTL